MRITYVSAEPQPGKEKEYWLAWKHRHLCGFIHNKTPWWQWKKRHRRFDKWMLAIRRTHQYGQDIIKEV